MMYYPLAGILVLAWLLGFGVFHVGGGSIHLLLVVAIVVLLWRLVAPRALIPVETPSRRRR